MSRWLVKGLLSAAVLLSAGCTEGPSNTFTFTAELPPGFAYKAIVRYVPAPGETCTVSRKDNTTPSFNRKWREAYKADSVIQIRRTVKGCPMVVRRVDLEIFATYGNDFGDFSSALAGIVIREFLEDRYTATFNASGESDFYGECQWLFRTSGTNRRLRKILNCKELRENNIRPLRAPFSAYTLDQLPGTTVRMKIALVNSERPYFKNRWLRFEHGWKRCLGEGPGDAKGYCDDEDTNFSKFLMPGGRECSIYPGCEE